MGLYHELALHQRKTAFYNSAEALFYRANAGVMANFDCFARYLKAGDPFDIVRANVIIRSLLSKRAIERAYREKLRLGRKGISMEEFMRERLSELPSFTIGDKKIYVPLFPSSLNSLYAKEWAKLTISPYLSLLKDFEPLIIDPFDYYGIGVYDSNFTRLVPVLRAGKEAAFYDYDAERLYFVNGQGRLEASLALFDEYLDFPQKTHMIQRLRPVAEAFFAFDEEKTLSALLDNRLISGRLIHKAAHKGVSEPRGEKR
ncbi:MAG: hypothetical protein LKG11_03485 [Bacilli bacterium]|jgi:hypothetical protein|nr:hypothetical protein [Bacilli bacterium]